MSLNAVNKQQFFETGRVFVKQMNNLSGILHASDLNNIKIDLNKELNAQTLIYLIILEKKD